MRQILILAICGLLLCSKAEARHVRHFGDATVAAYTKAKGKSKRIRARKRSARRVQKPVQSAADWDAVMRRNAQAVEMQPGMLQEEYLQWFKNLSDADLNLYLLFKLTDAIPVDAVEAEARRRGIR